MYVRGYVYNLFIREVLVMYTKETFAKYRFFKDLRLKYILDPLTGVLDRRTTIDFAKSLVKDKRPFTMMVIDIDNFKIINDNYGMLIGDECLKKMADNFVEFFGSKAIIGRYGGDQFAVLYLDQLNYDQVHEILEELYNGGRILRRNLRLTEVSPFITATIGSVSYPGDASTFDEVLYKLDKTMYRGKAKGRNCFIIYVDSKHKNIDTSKRAFQTTTEIIEVIDTIIDSDDHFMLTIKPVLKFVVDSLHIANAVVILKNGDIIEAYRDVPFDMYDINISEWGKLINDNSDRASYYNIRNINSISPAIYEVLFNNDAESILISKIRMKSNFFGYILFTETVTERVWQEKEETIIHYIEKLIAILGNNN